MQWLRFLGINRRRRSPFNNVDGRGQLTCGFVTPQLLIGGELGPDDWEALQKEGVSAVINMQQEQQDVWGGRERIDGYLWLPSPDGMAPSIAQLRQGVAFIGATIEVGLRVFVHCKAGQGRAPLLCACYLITLGATPLEATARVRQARPRTLLTPDQSARLREFASHHETLSTPASEDGATASQTPFDHHLHASRGASDDANSNGTVKTEERNGHAPIVKPASTRR